MDKENIELSSKKRRYKRFSYYGEVDIENVLESENVNVSDKRCLLTMRTLKGPLMIMNK